jgi:hypothetical protein
VLFLADATYGTSPQLPDEYAQFLSVLGALGKLVVLSMMLERALAFVFEHEWFIAVTTREVPDPTDASKTIRKSRIPGLKGLLALAAALGICFGYRFDVLGTLFGQSQATRIGILLTSLVAAGGSAGAIAIFQGYLGLSKDAREAQIAARRAEAETAVAEARAKKEKAEAERVESEARKSIAQMKLTQVSLALATRDHEADTPGLSSTESRQSSANKD